MSYFSEDIIENQDGGKQSDSPCRMDLVPAYSLLEISKVLAQGAEKYGADNWKLIETRDHLSHALTHIFGWLEGDRSENHLVNAGCRILFAIWAAREEENAVSARTETRSEMAKRLMAQPKDKR